MLTNEDFGRLQAIGLNNALLQAAMRATTAAAPPGAAALVRVVEVQRESLTVHDGRAALPARQLPALRQALAAQADALAVGDWAWACRNPLGEWWLHERVAPLNQLARRLHDGRDKVERVVIVSNVDTALLAMGLDHDFSLRRLERFVSLARMVGVEPVVVPTKADLFDDADWRREQVHTLLRGQVPVLALDGTAAASREALRPWLRPAHTLVLLGSSGAGKSTLTNTLSGAEVADTGANRAGDSRGRHTTTSRTLHLTPEGACLIDTPGLRTLRLDADEAGLDAAFEDITALARACRFRDCRHQGEPGCAVQGAVGEERLRNFHKLLREVQRDQLTALERKAQVQQWKARSRAGRQRALAKRV